jgi:hypothetical protein
MNQEQGSAMSDDKAWMVEGFGLKYAMKAALEAGAPVVWGARALWAPRTRPDLLRDRMGFITPPDIAGDERNRRLSALGDLINKNGYIDEAFKRIPSSLSGSDNQHLVLLDNEDVLIEANPNASYGYLYVCASPKPGKV